MTIKYSGNTDSIIKDYKFDPSAVYRVGGVRCIYSRGCFYTASTGKNMGYQQCLDQNKIEILIEACINPNCEGSYPHWIGLREFKDCGYAVACDYCEGLLVAYRPR